MEDLELLKKDWNKEAEGFEDYSEDEIDSMIKHKSVSVTKSLLIIGLIEILLWTMYGYIDGEFPYLRMILFIVFIGAAAFLFQSIRSGKDTLSLMKNILNLRRLVLGYAVVSFFLIIGDHIIHFKYYTKDFMAGAKDGWNKGHGIVGHTNPDGMVPEFGNYMVFTFFMLLGFYILYVIYKRTYGKILSDLRKNYKELSQEEDKAF